MHGFHAFVAGAVVLCALTASCAAPSHDRVERQAPEVRPTAALAPTGATASVRYDADDPAIWVNAAAPASSLILGTDKREQDGALYAFRLDGSIAQTIGPLDRPNNVDVEYDVELGAWRGDIAVVTERRQRRLRMFAIGTDGTLSDIAPNGLPVLAGETGEAAEPMGIGLYRRPRDGALFAIVAPKTGPQHGYLAQYRLTTSANGGPIARLVRRFGTFSAVGPEPGTPGEIEAVVVDDQLGYVYYSDERCCLRKYRADPDHAEAARELARLGEEGYDGDREGLALVPGSDGNGYLVSVDQVPGQTRLLVYARAGSAGNPHEHPLLARVVTSADATDGLDITGRALPGFDGGLLVAMNSGPRNFLLYRLTDILKAAALRR